MVLTEEEAREKWCCGPDNCGEKRDTGSIPSVYVRFCIASQCMAWRWYAAFVDNEAAPEAAKDDYAKQIGYCGLAGKPE